jgi:SnoaL-like domain
VDADALRALVDRYWSAVWGDQDLAAIDELMAEPYLRHSAAGTKRLTRAELKAEIAYTWELLHGAHTTVDDQAVSGDRVWTRATTTGVNLHTGEPSSLTWLIVHRIADGLLVESWSATIPDVDWR